MITFIAISSTTVIIIITIIVIVIFSTTIIFIFIFIKCSVIVIRRSVGVSLFQLLLQRSLFI
jgi:hypothetical protein